MIFSSSTVCVQPSPKSYSYSHFLCCGKHLDSLTLSSECILDDVMDPAEITIAWYDHSPLSYTYALITSGQIPSFSSALRIASSKIRALTTDSYLYSPHVFYCIQWKVQKPLLFPIIGHRGPHGKCRMILIHKDTKTLRVKIFFCFHFEWNNTFSIIHKKVYFRVPLIICPVVDL